MVIRKRTCELWFPQTATEEIKRFFQKNVASRNIPKQRKNDTINKRPKIGYFIVDHKPCEFRKPSSWIRHLIRKT